MTTATVKYPAGEPRDTKNGLKINALVILPTGEEVRIWGNPGEQPLASWTKGQQVQLEQKGQYWNIAKGATNAAPQAAPAQSAPQQPAPALTRIDLDSEETRQALLAKGQHLADIYREVMRRLAEGDPADPLDTFRIREEDIQAATATVFISLFRHV